MHVIRLRHPWSRRVGDDAAESRVDVPDESDLPTPESQRVTYRRRFNRPTGLETGDRVSLQIESFCGDRINVHLNETLIGEGLTVSPIRLPITSQLCPANRLTIEVFCSDAAAPRIDGEVTIRIDQD